MENKKSIGKFLLGLAVTAFLAIIMKAFLLPDNVENFGFYSLVPAVFLIVYIFCTKRIIEALTLASVMCFVMCDGLNFFSEFNNGIIEVMLDSDMAWLIVVCGLMGSIIALIEKAGGSFAFGKFVSEKTKTRKGTLLWTWLLGVAIFIDDYLSCLTLGSCMAPITDQKRVSREYLSYIVDATAAPTCVLVPITTWAVFIGRLLYMNGLCAEEESIPYFIKTIPFNFYSWATVIIALLLILGWFPLMGSLKKAEKRVKDGGPLAPEGSEKMTIHINSEAEAPKQGSIWNFLLPVVCLIVSTVIFDIDMQKGVIFTLAFMFLLYVIQGIMTAEEFADVCVEGLKSMVMPLLLMVLAFLFSYASARINFTEQVITSVIPLMQNTPQIMPAIIFLVLSATEFITGTNWGMYIIALPIVVPLSHAVGGNTLLAVSAVLSAGVLGSHVCFYSDATILSSAASGCNNFDHAKSQLPYGLIAAGIAFFCFLISGFYLTT